MPGAEPGTFYDRATGATWALPSSFGTFDTFGPVTRDEHAGLVARVDRIAEQIAQRSPQAVARMVEQMEGMDDGG